MRSAWTLVEVLVAMGVILVLAGLAMPWLAEARGAGARSVCQQHMASHLVTIHAYTNDYRDVWPFALPRGFGAGVQPDLAPPSSLGWYEATPAMWFMALKDEYGEGAFTASLLCPADRQTEAERARLAAARGVPIERVAALTPRVLSLALYLDPAALDPERPEWHPRYFRVTRRAETQFPDRKAALIEVVPFHEQTYQPGVPSPTTQRHLMVASVDGSARYRWSEDWVPGVVFDAGRPVLVRQLEAELNKLTHTPHGVRGWDW